MLQWPTVFLHPKRLIGSGVSMFLLLQSAVQKGLIALGDAGEMATRLILIHALQKTLAI
jgi:hypothetical protein